MKSTKEKHNSFIIKAILILLALAVTSLFLFLLKKEQIGVEKMEMPEAMEELADEENIEWMAGIWVGLTDCTLLTNENSLGIDEYLCGSNSLQAEIKLQNGLAHPQPYYFMILADGLPTQFSIGSENYLSYPLSLTNKQEKIKVEISPNFSQNLGRLDFLLFYNGNAKSDFHMTTYTIFIRSNGAVQQPIQTYKTMEQRSGVKNTFSDGAFGAWLWDGAEPPASADLIGCRDIRIQQGEPLIFEAIASEPGLYRTIFIMSDHPLFFSSGGICGISIDWISHGTDMLQIPVELCEVPMGPASFLQYQHLLVREWTRCLV